MPSLDVSKIALDERQRSTYDHFYRKIIKRYNEEKSSLIGSFVMCLITVGVITLSIEIITAMIWIGIAWNFEDFYQQYQLYIVYNIIQILSQLIISSLMTYSFFNQYA